MRLHTTAALLVGTMLVVACAGQPDAPEDGQLGLVAAGESGSEELEEIRLNAEAVRLGGNAPSRPTLGSDTVCEDFTPTGSHLSKTRCTTRAERRREAEEAQEWMRTDGISGSISTSR